MSLEDLIKLMEKAAETGVTELESGDVKLKLKHKDPIKTEPKKEVQDLTAEQLVKPASVLDEMSPEEILFYATPYYDELQAQKEEHAKKLAEETISTPKE